MDVVPAFDFQQSISKNDQHIYRFCTSIIMAIKNRFKVMKQPLHKL